MSQVPYVPHGMNSVSPHLIIKGVAEAIDFYRKAFGAEVLCRMDGPDGHVCHAEVRIGSSVVMMCEESPKWGAFGPVAVGGSPVTIALYVPDVDATVARAVEHGATLKMPVADMFWGDRYGKVKDPFGHEWSIATKIKNLSPEEMEAAQKAAFANEKPGA